MTLYFLILGYGFGFQIGGFDVHQSCFVILAWHIIKHHQVWRSETHSRGTEGSRTYHYRCIKNGKVVEEFSLHSPIVNHI